MSQKRNRNRTRRNRTEPNPLVTEFRQLRSRQARERTGTFYIEGNRIVAQAAKSGAAIERCIIAPEVISSEQIWETVAILRDADVPVEELSADDFGRISFKRNLHGIGAVVRAQLESLSDIDMADSLGWVALDHVSNPGNLGAIMRTCDAVGCAGIMMLDDTVDPFHPDAVRASMGALFSLRLARAPFMDFAEWKRKYGYSVIGTSDKAQLSYREASYSSPSILLMGSERVGLSDEKQAVCDLVVRIPMVGTSDSLNLAVATSVVLYEVFHQYGQS